MYDVIVVSTDDVPYPHSKRANSERPASAAELLRALANKIDTVCEELQGGKPVAPFVVRHVAVDLYNGEATAYIEIEKND
jgi:hypothetical protein